MKELDKPSEYENRNSAAIDSFVVGEASGMEDHIRISGKLSLTSEAVGPMWRVSLKNQAFRREFYDVGTEMMLKKAWKVYIDDSFSC